MNRRTTTLTKGDAPVRRAAKPQHSQQRHKVFLTELIKQQEKSLETVIIALSFAVCTHKQVVCGVREGHIHILLQDVHMHHKVGQAEAG